MTSARVVSVDKLGEEPFAPVLCYPMLSKAEVEKRLKELKLLGIRAFEFQGEKRVSKMSVLGKGYVGVVVVVHRDSERLALKIRRTDAEVERILHEAQMLTRANSVKVGPKFVGGSGDFLLMEFVDGILLPQWIRNNSDKAQVSRVLRLVLEQCWRLDELGLDHGELVHAPKHIIVAGNEQPFIVDFETASDKRRPSNVTSICQFLFVNGSVAADVSERLRAPDKETLFEVLRCYKGDRTRANFVRVLGECGL